MACTRLWGDKLTDEERETPGTAWNAYVRQISLRSFAKIHGDLAAEVQPGHGQQDDRKDKGTEKTSHRPERHHEQRCELLDQNRLDSVFKTRTYYTRGHAANEKGVVENYSRLVRR